MKTYTCHDCQTILKEGDSCMPYEVGQETFVKCSACYKKDAVLRNFQKTEVYTRVVGYIRPVQQWNKGKQAEYSNRKEYKCSPCSV